MESPSDPAEAVVSSDAAISSEEAVAKATIDKQLREELKDELRQLIKPWKNTTTKPPLTAEELIVIGMVLGSSSTCTAVMVQQFIIREFRYYTNLALACTSFVDSTFYQYSRHASKRKSEKFVRECDMVYRQFDVPFQKANMSSWRHKYSVSTAATRIFLQDRLSSSSKADRPQKPFPFLRLPAELRNRIYGLVLQFPKSGLCVKVKREEIGSARPKTWPIPAKFSVLRKKREGFDQIKWSELSEAYRDYAADADLMDLPERVLYCPPAATYLNLLRANKQIFNEAMPIFYSTNKFIFPRVTELYWFLEATPAARRKHIECVGFHYLACDTKYVNAAFRMLKDIPHLRELDIAMDEDDWKRETNRKSSTPKYPDLLKIPGMFTLRSFRGLEAVRFHDNCDTFKVLIPEMTSEKKKAKAPVKRPRKRKAQADVDYVEPVEDPTNGEDNPDQSAPPKKKARKPKKSNST
ncbi:hypothetical protein PRZ48_012088 [Zasmidium cellare]|uniref:DUF7730 domain-containing protein n=1 Tax=Zasmidium cellare TaxID=395010 RepID=A0ABR0E457_ZASCE|nr:hypothetical protein PRZ48_012088 [Zasmidium cellare]